MVSTFNITVNEPKPYPDVTYPAQECEVDLNCEIDMSSLFTEEVELEADGSLPIPQISLGGTSVFID